ncbi:Crp/Fnr family transcriptional regulator [uncultured Aquimarina sp.]|uniref:Crp/Fnr family transcriptional regulator n=1 Tax=uncultured Aquimarina sp. TaxID=575652 RepID=UPI002625262B|nr:Crp/Fnr family transcriptional regulator [uncultured Aquimarina sp.]
MNQLKVKKGDILQRKGDLNTKIYYVKSGLLRSYAIDKKGKEHIFLFGPEGWAIADNLPPDTPSDLYIDAIEDSTVTVALKQENINNAVIKAAPILKRLSVLQKRVIMLMSASAIERYEHFMEVYPEIAKRVPQRMIASYLGITPEALSKVKGDKIRSK